MALTLRARARGRGAAWGKGAGAKQLPFPCVPLYFPRGLVCAILDADRTEDSTPRRAAFGGDITCGRYAISHANLCKKIFLADGAP